MLEETCILRRPPTKLLISTAQSQTTTSRPTLSDSVIKSNRRRFRHTQEDSMRRGRVSALMAVGFGLALRIIPPDAQNNGAKQTAPRPRTDTQLSSTAVAR